MGAENTPIDMYRESDNKAKNTAKVKPEDEAELKAWIEAVTGESLAEGSLHNALKSGAALCKLVNAIEGAGIIKKIHPDTAAIFRQMENITFFLNACKAHGMMSWDLFLTTDLYEGNDMRSVMDTISMYGGAVQNLPTFSGPHYGVAAKSKLGAARSAPKATLPRVAFEEPVAVESKPAAEEEQEPEPEPEATAEEEQEPEPEPEAAAEEEPAAEPEPEPEPEAAAEEEPAAEEAAAEAAAEEEAPAADGSLSSRISARRLERAEERASARGEVVEAAE